MTRGPCKNAHALLAFTSLLAHQTLMAPAERMDIMDRILIAFVSTPGMLRRSRSTEICNPPASHGAGAIVLPLMCAVLAAMFFHFNDKMLFHVFTEG